MQDAAQYGAVDSPPPPPKRFGRKTVVALASLGLAGVAALSLAPQKKGATGLVVKYTGESRGKSDCGGLDWFCPFMCAGNRNNYNTKRCCRCFPAPTPPGPDCTRRSPIGGGLEMCPTLCQPWRLYSSAPYTKDCKSCVEINQLRAQRRVDGVRASEVDFHTGCTCPNCYRPSPIGGGMEKCPELCAGNLITSPYAKQCCQCAQA